MHVVEVFPDYNLDMSSPLIQRWIERKHRPPPWTSLRVTKVEIVWPEIGYAAEWVSADCSPPITPPPSTPPMRPPPPSRPPPPPLPPPPPSPPQVLVCSATEAPVCAGPSEPCYRDARCLEPWNDPHGGMGCNAGGKGQACRFCGFGLFASITCPSASPACSGQSDDSFLVMADLQIVHPADLTPSLMAEILLELTQLLSAELSLDPLQVSTCPMEDNQVSAATGRSLQAVVMVTTTTQVALAYDTSEAAEAGADAFNAFASGPKLAAALESHGLQLKAFAISEEIVLPSPAIAAALSASNGSAQINPAIMAAIVILTICCLVGCILKRRRSKTAKTDQRGAVQALDSHREKCADAASGKADGEAPSNVDEESRLVIFMLQPCGSGGSGLSVRALEKEEEVSTSAESSTWDEMPSERGMQHATGILRVQEGSAAQLQGVPDGTSLVRINSRFVADLTLDEVAAALEGVDIDLPTELHLRVSGKQLASIRGNVAGLFSPVLGGAAEEEDPEAAVPAGHEGVQSVAAASKHVVSFAASPPKSAEPAPAESRGDYQSRRSHLDDLEALDTVSGMVDFEISSMDRGGEFTARAAPPRMVTRGGTAGVVARGRGGGGGGLFSARSGGMSSRAGASDGSETGRQQPVRRKSLIEAKLAQARALMKQRKAARAAATSPTNASIDSSHAATEPAAAGIEWLGERLGGGITGPVFKGRRITSLGLHGRILAVRRMKEAACALWADSRSSLEEEMAQLGKLHHTHLLTPELSYGSAKNGGASVLLAVPFAHSSLAALLSFFESDDLPLMARDAPKALSIGMQTAEAVGFLHSRGIWHGSLWPRNVMLGGKDGLHVKLMDHGRPDRLLRALHAVDHDEHVLRPPAPTASDLFRSPYMAPECTEASHSGSAKMLPRDCWSLGCLLIRMCLSRPLYADELAEMEWLDLLAEVRASRRSPVDAMRWSAAALSSSGSSSDALAMPPAHPHHSVGDATFSGADESRTQTGPVVRASHSLQAGQFPAGIIELASRCCAISTMRRPKAKACHGFLSQMHRELQPPSGEPQQQGTSTVVAVYRSKPAMKMPHRLAPRRLPPPSAEALTGLQAMPACKTQRCDIGRREIKAARLPAPNRVGGCYTPSPSPAEKPTAHGESTVIRTARHGEPPRSKLGAVLNVEPQMSTRIRI